jgi:hypothetical protein
MAQFNCGTKTTLCATECVSRFLIARNAQTGQESDRKWTPRLDRGLCAHTGRGAAVVMRNPIFAYLFRLSGEL